MMDKSELPIDPKYLPKGRVEIENHQEIIFSKLVKEDEKKKKRSRPK